MDRGEWRGQRWCRRRFLCLGFSVSWSKSMIVTCWVRFSDHQGAAPALRLQRRGCLSSVVDGLQSLTPSMGVSLFRSRRWRPRWTASGMSLSVPSRRSRGPQPDSLRLMRFLLVVWVVVSENEQWWYFRGLSCGVRR
ncbi:hypothetical protein IWZ00DRAFT_514610 [Phyllosticta capitalensis]|uniref:Uncharacterized protein n=1 Tax=Phyllosticta capitalensis TaxID=121624 RepID=A0ABR1YGR7_9PEZI